MEPWQSIGHLSKQEINALQNKKLHSFLNHYVYPFSPHYRKVFDEHKIDPKKIKTVADLRRIPFTSKSNFVNEGRGQHLDFVLQPDAQKIKKAWPASKILPLAFKKIVYGNKAAEHALTREFRPVFMTLTTGTTSRPVPFLYSNYDMYNLNISGARMMKLFDVDCTEKVVNMFPYAPHLAFWQVVCGGMEACNLVLSTGGGKVMGTEGNVSALCNMKPSLLIGVPSYVYHVLRVAREQGQDLSFLKKIVLGASKVTIAFKKKLIELCAEMGANDVSVFGTYGFTEARCAWAECPTPVDQSSGYFLYPDKEIFEVIDPDTGEQKGEGEDGELVYTCLDARASVVLRYRTGDFVRGGITYQKCPYTGLTVPRISSDIVRLSNVKDLNLSKVKGTLVNFNTFSTILSSLEAIDEWQIVIAKKNDDPFEMDEMSLYLVARKGFSKEDIEQKVRKEMLSLTEISPTAVHFINMSEMVMRLGLETENKEKRILDVRPKE